MVDGHDRGHQCLHSAFLRIHLFPVVSFYKRLKVHRLAFKIVSEIRITGNYNEYRPRIKQKNIFLSVVAGTILILSLTLMVLIMIVDEEDA